MKAASRQRPPSGKTNPERPGAWMPIAGSKAVLIALASICLVGVLGYCNTLHSPFVLDDDGSIVFNASIRDWSNLKAIWTFSSARVITYLTLAVNYHFSRLSLPSYHITNLAIHILTSIVVFLLVRVLFRTPGCGGGETRRNGGLSSVGEFYVPLFAALLFVSHPIQTQAVTYVIQRTASLVTLFYLLAMYLYVRGRLAMSGGEEKGRGIAPYLWFGISLVSVVLAMLTKQNAVTLPVAIALVEIFFFTPSMRKIRTSVLVLIPFMLTLAIIPAVMMSAQNLNLGEISELGSESKALSRSDYLLTQFNVIRTYLRLIVLPVNQNLDYDYPVSHTLLAPATFLSFLLLVGVFAFGVWLFRRNRLASFGIMFFFLSLAVESSVVPIVDVIFEHRMYLPAAGIFLTASVLFFSLFAPREVRSAKGSVARFPGTGRIALAVAIVVLCCGATFYRNLAWRSALSLWADAAMKSPKKARPQLNLGVALQDRGRVEEAKQCYVRALELEPNYTHAMANLGGILAQEGQFAEAERYCDAAAKMDPKFAVAHLNLAITLAVQGKYAQAEEHFRRATELRAEYSTAEYNWGYALLLQAKYEEAIRHFQETLRIDPTYADAQLDWGNALLRQGKREEAIGHFEEALRLRPNYEEARQALEKARL